MDPPIFRLLVEELKNLNLLRDSREGFKVERQLFQFFIILNGKIKKVKKLKKIFIGGTYTSVRNTFGGSRETVGKYFHKVLNAIIKFSKIEITAPDSELVFDYIKNNPKFTPWFEPCLGALDGTHIGISVPVDLASPFRNYKTSTLTQNVLGICDFNLLFTLVLTGWEGSAPDSRVLAFAFEKNLLAIPNGRFYLADAGYGLTKNILTPYRGVRYHLREWLAGNERFKK